MRKPALHQLLCYVLMLFTIEVHSQSTKSYAVMLRQEGTTWPPVLRWNADTFAVSYQVFRKSPSSSNWGSAIATLGKNDTSFVETASGFSVAEYYVQKTLNNGRAGHGYVIASANPVRFATGGGLLLLIDENYVKPLTNEIKTLIADLTADGYSVDTITIARNLSPKQVKTQIILWYNSRINGSIKPNTVYLLGRISVPYSGEIFPDGHRPDHRGAWPADVYYGMMNENSWTDAIIDTDSAEFDRNRNRIGDGKFDIDFIFPDTPALQIGRVDLTDMPAFGVSDTLLVKQYLQRAHAFKHAQLVPDNRALVDDHFGAMNGEAFAASGWRNFSAMLPSSAINEQDYLPSVKNGSYLLAYGCGAGTYISAFGVANTNWLVSDSIHAVFHLLFGSYFGDWDNTNNFLRAPLCSKPMALASVWSGRPNWIMHHMGVGANIGYATKLTQSNVDGRLLTPQALTNYHSNNFPSYIHISLMGDPTLRLRYAEAPKQLTATPNADSTVYQLNWEPVNGAIGYEIYAAFGAFNSGNKIAEVTGTSYILNQKQQAANHIYVKALVLHQSGSAPYLMPSLGSLVKVKSGLMSGVVNNLVSQTSVQLFPNPATTSFMITGINGVVQVELYDLMGRLHQSYSEVNAGEPLQTGLLKGQFMVRIKKDGEVMQHKRLLIID